MSEMPERRDRGWPAWLDALRPDSLARRRMRRDIERRAAPLLEAARRSWTDVATEWARPLVPLAAGLVLVCGALAWAAAMDGPGEPTAGLASAEEAALPWEAVPGEAADAPPVLLTGFYEPSADGILSAAIYQSRPGSPGADEGR